jgi:hypothetical protein
LLGMDKEERRDPTDKSTQNSRRVVPFLVFFGLLAVTLGIMAVLGLYNIPGTSRVERP